MYKSNIDNMLKLKNYLTNIAKILNIRKKEFIFCNFLQPLYTYDFYNLIIYFNSFQYIYNISKFYYRLTFSFSNTHNSSKFEVASLMGSITKWGTTFDDKYYKWNKNV